MLVDMTVNDWFKTQALSRFKVAYFRIPEWGKEKNGLINGNPPVLELCLIPHNKDIKSTDNYSHSNREIVKTGEQVFQIPPDAIVIKVRAGDDWPDLDTIYDEWVEKNEEMKRLEQEECDEYTLSWDEVPKIDFQMAIPTPDLGEDNE